MLPVKDLTPPARHASGRLRAGLAAPAALLPQEAASLLAAMPMRFSLGQILEEAERRGETARQGYLYLQALIAEKRVVDDGRWLMKTAAPA